MIGAPCPYSTGKKWDMAFLRPYLRDLAVCGIEHPMLLKHRCQCGLNREAGDGHTIRCSVCGDILSSADVGTILAECERQNAEFDRKAQ